MGKKKSVTVGFWYSFGIHMGLCHGPVNDLIEIRVGDKTAWHGSIKGGGRINISAPELFGGEKAEGGIEGPFDLYMGYPSQESIPGLEAMVKEPRPAMRQRVTAFFNGRISAMNPYPKPWAFRVRRTTEGWDSDVRWYPEKATILMTRPTTPGEVTSSAEIHAMNPAHIIYECLTNRLWGRGLPASRLDSSSFFAAADRLHSEGFGLCMRWVRRDSLKNFVGSILDHIAGALYNDPSTGLLVLKLIRFDYDVNSLPLFDTDSGLLTIEEAPVVSLGPMVNEYVVKFRDPITNKDGSVKVHNLANIQASNGNFNSISREFPGLPTGELALRVAQRELRATSVGLRRFKVTLDRRAWELAPAGVFRVQDLSRRIPDTVLRIGRIDRGTLTNGTITIDAVSDVFSFPLTSFTKPQYPPNRPVNEPLPAIARVFEIPYFILSRYTNPADFAHISDYAGFPGTVAARPSPIHGGYDIGVRDGLPTPDDAAQP